MHLTRRATGQRFQGVGVEAQLQDVSRLALDPRELRVDRFIRAVPLDGVIDSNQEIGDAPNTFVNEGHLIDDVMALVHGITNAGRPLQKRLIGIASRHLIDASPVVFEFLQAVAFVLRTFFDEEIGQRSHRSWLDDQHPGVGSISE